VQAESLAHMFSAWFSFNAGCLGARTSKKGGLVADQTSITFTRIFAVWLLAEISVLQIHRYSTILRGGRVKSFGPLACRNCPVCFG
jgi:hypothetical protein